MLILTRRVGETVMIGDDVTVTVLGVKGNQVRLGVGLWDCCWCWQGCGGIGWNDLRQRRDRVVSAQDFGRRWG